MPKDAPETTIDTAVRDAERVYRCAACAREVTRGRWEIALDGGHERSFFNPAGVVFRVLCFKEAPGAAEVGPPTQEFTWFRGYAWRYAICRGCGAHLGWRYEGEPDPAVFFGLIKRTLTVDNE
ncbi:MAG TPA: cereblon family protein [Azospirillum sp.]|nr:cereblon family protein [Azospirillum sp.]